MSITCTMTIRSGVRAALREMGLHVLRWHVIAYFAFVRAAARAELLSQPAALRRGGCGAPAGCDYLWTAIKACSVPDSREGLAVLQGEEMWGLQPHVISLCSHQCMLQVPCGSESFQLFVERRRLRHQPEVISFTAAINVHWSIQRGWSQRSPCSSWAMQRQGSSPTCSPP